ncbi:hypothetical protein M406DRAFT_68795 [Cryphonectria parasitica EP155]|uniref:WSC domain-containing protein n=1 Tax=Cryphonectria parasitica (strain ATCC 38755 / EP155) TaxID=660469 RepID=A0A9P4Y5F3_CRYP1|nr:uncharacterized protein M406DRAFT_68795 [Cryphonectria parasitica EP155]KAF3766455.1 hypothetical protein M406DRAFT_68795 [Cryphonectria parasitica EP155]
MTKRTVDPPNTGIVPTVPEMPIPSNVGNYHFAGCFSHVDPLQHVFTGQHRQSQIKMSVSLCATVCRDTKSPMMGLEASSTCYCGTALESCWMSETLVGNCDMPCSGNSLQMCGGDFYTQIYISGDAGGQDLDPICTPLVPDIPSGVSTTSIVSVTRPPPSTAHSTSVARGDGTTSLIQIDKFSYANCSYIKRIVIITQSWITNLNGHFNHVHKLTPNAPPILE